MKIFFMLGSLIIMVSGCEAVKGVTNDIANTARNVSDIFSAGKTIGDVVK